MNGIVPSNVASTVKSIDRADPREVRATMARAIALKAAASEIASHGFPPRSLPRVAPLPFVHLGHLVVFDFGVFARAVWSVALALKPLIEKHERLEKLAAGFAVGTIVGVAWTCFTKWGFGWGLLWSILPGGIVWAAIVRTSSNFRQARHLRREMAEGLLSGVEPSLPTRQIDFPWIPWADGRLGEGFAPVLVSDGRQKFPGFGRVQVEQLFVAPLDDDAETSVADEEAIRGIINDRVLGAARTAGFPNVICGHVVVVHGESLRLGSPWLVRGTPRLWLEETLVRQAEQMDAFASVRAYTAVQILFPQHETCATLFVRVFSAGSSVSVEITLSTLGPLVTRDADIHERLLELRAEPRRLFQSEDEAATLLGKALQTWRRGVQSSRGLFGALPAGARELEPCDSTEQRELAREANLVVQETTKWPGAWVRLGNWREENSWTFSADYFGSVESRAAVRALYQRIAGAALDALAESGCDISEYRDEEGRWNIHADKIDSLVVGERVFMNEKNKDAAPKAKAESTG